MPLVILHHLLNVSVQLANKRGLKKLRYLLGNSVSPDNMMVMDVEQTVE
jgi:hypothetical protein